MMEQKKNQSPLTPNFNLDDFFTTQEQRDEEKKEKIEEVELSLIDSFPKHPFKVIDNNELVKLEESINEHGLLEPILVRPKENGRYEIISGHRRKRASEVLGAKTIRCIIKDLTDDEAIISMVDSNLHREKILPSEKAFAYKMKLDAMNHQGRKSTTLTPMVSKLRTNEILGEENGESRETIRRYIRLTKLIPQLLQMVDNSELGEIPAIAKRPGAELSFLKVDEQKELVNAIKYNYATPSLAQAIKLKKLSLTNKLDKNTMYDILGEEKPNQVPKIQIREDKIKNVIPKNVRVDNMEDFVVKAVEFYSKHLRVKNRGDR